MDLAVAEADVEETIAVEAVRVATAGDPPNSVRTIDRLGHANMRLRAPALANPARTSRRRKVSVLLQQKAARAADCCVDRETVARFRAAATTSNDANSNRGGSRRGATRPSVRCAQSLDDLETDTVIVSALATDVDHFWSKSSCR